MTDDRRDDSIPDPEAPATEAERARARAFARLVDGLVAGEPAPPALEAEDRELLDTASRLRAAVREAPLDARRRQLLIDQAFGRALGLPAPAPSDELDGKRRGRAGAAPSPGRLRRSLPWAMAGLAAAAAVALALTRPARPAGTAAALERPALQEFHRSRPASPLVGRIDRANADRASARIDLIVADRMAGYRDLYLRGLKGGTR